ncbi:hypothetical protein D9M69_269500 [compost metagenome]
MSLADTRSDSSRIVAIVDGHAETAWIMLFRPSSIRLASSTSCLRVSRVAELISRMYMRTGSVVRPNSESTVDSATSASSSAWSSEATAGPSLSSSVSASGVCS